MFQAHIVLHVRHAQSTHSGTDGCYLPFRLPYGPRERIVVLHGIVPIFHREKGVGIGV